MKKLYIVLLSCLLTVSLIAQSNELELLILDKMETYHVPGLAVAIVTPNGICYEGYFGMANFAEDRPVDTSTIFMLASVSKTITATAVLKLHQEGYFELDDDINSYLPFDVHIPDYPDESITFRHLLTHTSSIRDNWDLMPYCTGDCTTSLYDFLFDYLDPEGDNYDPNNNFSSSAPGTGFVYCNIGFALLGLLVEEISDTPFNEYCNTVLFDKMEMNNSRWFLSETDTSMLAMPYKYNSNTESYEAWGHYGYMDYPDGQLRSTTHDLANFLLTYIQGGSYNDETSILDPDIVQLLTPSDFSDGLAWGISSSAGYNMWAHGGGDRGVITQIGFSPQDSTGVILLTNGESGFGSNGLWAVIKAYARENCVNADPVSTAEIQKLSRVEIFPNPNQGIINIDLGSLTDVSLKVINVSGQFIYSKENINTPKYQFELDAAPGIYILELSAKGEKQQFKLVKQ